MPNTVAVCTVPAALSTIAPMGSPHDDGEAVRRAMLREIQRRDREKLPPPSWRELAVAAAKDTGHPRPYNPRTMTYHARIMRDTDKTITYFDGLARTTRLTAKGRRTQT